MSSSESDIAQRERAHQSWELVIFDSPRPEVLEALRKILRVKRFELEAAAAALPGAIRRGARIDLAPLESALTAVGIRCQLRRSTGPHGARENRR
jgi:DNA-binding transcriptional regulator PaaX